jgi:hypothetical protein
LFSNLISSRYSNLVFDVTTLNHSFASWRSNRSENHNSIVNFRKLPAWLCIWISLCFVGCGLRPNLSRDQVETTSFKGQLQWRSACLPKTAPFASPDSNHLVEHS